MKTELIVRKVIARLKEIDMDIVVDFVKSNLDNPDKLIKYFDSYTLRNKIDKVDKVNILKKLKSSGIDLTAPHWEKVITNFGVIYTP